MTEKTYKVRCPILQPYSWVREVMKSVAGVPRADVLHLIQSIFEKTGTPQDPVDWSKPDEWIDARLEAKDAALAMRIWQQSNHLVNPRHIYGVYLFINSYELLVEDSKGVYAATSRGTSFLANDPATLLELDELEGMMKLLEILSTKAQAKRGDLLPEWSAYLQEWSKFSKPSTHTSTLRYRLLNLVERGFVNREGIYYTITDAGLHYIDQSGPVAEDPKMFLVKQVKSFNQSQREALRQALSTINPYQFEHLIGALMEAMGYEDVEVTKQSGDKGVDVVAMTQFGITTVREVLQVKRHSKGSLPRTVVDQLRGSLIYFQAIRGTIITLGDVSKGAKEAAVYPGAAPITLIDGDRLLDLLIEHEVGIKKKAVSLLELDLVALKDSVEQEHGVDSLESES